MKKTLKVIVLCTLSTGLDSISHVIRKGFSISCIVGLNPKNADPENISGFVDVKEYAAKEKIDYIYVNSYSLKDDFDQCELGKHEFEWNSNLHASGVYIFRATIDKTSYNEKILLLK